jgi:uncharacterized protein (DUF1697 family)
MNKYVAFLRAINIAGRLTVDYSARILYFL